MTNQEIDRQVAEKVMGYREAKEDDVKPIYPAFLVRKYGGDLLLSLEEDSEWSKYNPSTNIAHALKSLESKRLMGTMRLTINARKKYVHFSCWCPETQQKGEATVDVTDGLDKAIAMAICLSVLDAISEK